MLKRVSVFVLGYLVILSAMANEFPNLPIAVSNNAVASLPSSDGPVLFSFAGLLEGKTWRDVTSKAWWLPAGSERWKPLPPVPGKEGRLAAIAVAANDSVWLFGGYTVAENGSEKSTPETFQVNPNQENIYQRMSDMPVPVDDMAALVYQDRYIYLISGWHDVGNVNLVQVYDTHTDQWQQATPWPGAPVFGQSGGIVGNNLLVCGGVFIDYPAKGNRDFLITNACWQGTISTSNIRRISWRPVDPMPVSGRYRAASVGIKNDSSIVFIGGTDNPYNYDGIGYNGTPSEPLAEMISFDLIKQRWRCHGNNRTTSMDHRGLLVLGEQTVLRIGGMLAGQKVTDKVLQEPIAEPSDCE